MNFWDFIKIKSFCTAKETVNKTKRQPTEWEKMTLQIKGWYTRSIKNFSNSTPKKQISTQKMVRETKDKMNLWDFIRIKSFCTAKETVKQTKRQPMEWEKIFANDTTDKVLVARIYKELLKLNT